MNSSFIFDTPVLSRQDKNYLHLIHSFIEDELSFLTSFDLSKERFLIYKQALNKILDYVQAYKELLGSIKREYELCINTLENGQNETEKVTIELNKTIAHPTTLLNLNKRKEELQEIIEHLKMANVNLSKKLKDQLIKNKRFRPDEPAKIKTYAFLSLQKPKQDDDNTLKKVQIPGVSLEKSTDLKYLTELLQKVMTKLKQTNDAKQKNYSKKFRKQELNEMLLNKIYIRDDLQAKNDALKRKVYLFRVAMSSAKLYYEGNSQYSTILDALTKSLLNGSLLKQIKLDDKSELVESDNHLEYEAEYILDYIDKFNELFENGMYRDAAYYAAASVKGVLRNMETMYRFKGVSNVELGDSDPLLLYCTALLDSIENESSRPNEIMSLECIKISLAHDKLDVLTRWVAERKLRFSYAAAQSIEEYVELNAKYTRKGLELALFIYNDLNAVLKTAYCLAKLGRFASTIEYLSQQENLPIVDVYLRVLHKCPELDLAMALSESPKVKNTIRMEQIVAVLLDSCQPSNGLKFLKLQIDKLSIIDSTPSLLDENTKEEIKKRKEKLNESYQTLNKFAYLANSENDPKMDEGTLKGLRSSIEEFRTSIENASIWQTIDDNSADVLYDASTGSITESISLIAENNLNVLHNVDTESIHIPTAHSIPSNSNESNPNVHVDFYNKFGEMFDND